jgi:hypothetical protein
MKFPISRQLGSLQCQWIFAIAPNCQRLFSWPGFAAKREFTVQYLSQTADWLQTDRLSQTQTSCKCGTESLTRTSVRWFNSDLSEFLWKISFITAELSFECQALCWICFTSPEMDLYCSFSYKHVSPLSFCLSQWRVFIVSSDFADYDDNCPVAAGYHEALYSFKIILLITKRVHMPRNNLLN